MAKSKKVSSALAPDAPVPNPAPVALTVFVLTEELGQFVREGASAAAAADGSKKKAAEAIAAAGGRGYMFTKSGVSGGLVSPETLGNLRGAIAAGLLTGDEFGLYARGAKAAAADGLQSERNALTSRVSAYLASFRGMIETAWATTNPEEAEAEAAEAEAAAAETEAEDAAPVIGAELRKRLLDLIGDVAAASLENQKEILESLNDAEMLMVNW